MDTRWRFPLRQNSHFSLRRYQQTMQNTEDVFLHPPLLTLSHFCSRSHCALLHLLWMCVSFERVWVRWKSQDDDLCRCMHRNSSRPYDVVFLLKNMRNTCQGEQSGCVCVSWHMCLSLIHALCTHMVTLTWWLSHMVKRMCCFTFFFFFKYFWHA